MFVIAVNPLAHGHKPEDSLAFQTFGFIEKCVTEGIAQGRFAAPEEHEALLPHVIWAHIHGAASLALSGRLGMLPDEAHGPLFEAVVETTLRGLQAA